MKLVSDDYPETNEKEKIRLALVRYSWQWNKYNLDIFAIVINASYLENQTNMIRPKVFAAIDRI